MPYFTGSEKTKGYSDILVEFLEIAFNAVLHLRKVYPSSVFILKKKYGIPVRITTHPKISNYIAECLKTVKQLIEWESLEHISLVISLNSQVIERYVYELLQGASDREDRFLLETEESFRVYLLRLGVCTSAFTPLPDDATFSIQVATSSQSSVLLNESVSQAHFPWIEDDALLTIPTTSVITPLKTFHTQNVALQMYIESAK